jgi:hyperosmotically inducible periplasmic protein
MKKRIEYVLLGAALTLASGPALAFGTEDDLEQSGYVKAFQGMDKDQDGTLTKSEVGSEKLFTKNFSAADTDHDGTLDQDEYTKYRSEHEKKVAKRVVKDSWITSKVKTMLLKDEGMKSMKVSVETHQGVVLLSGFVDTPEQIKQAEQIAASVEGVKSVKNSLMLRKSS